MCDRVSDIYEELKAIDNVLESLEKAIKESKEKNKGSVILSPINVDKIIILIEAHQSYLKGRLVI